MKGKEAEERRDTLSVRERDGLPVRTTKDVLVLIDLISLV